MEVEKEKPLTSNPSKLNYFLDLILKSGTFIFLTLTFLSFLGEYFLVNELLCHFQVFYLACAFFGLFLGLIVKSLQYILIHAIMIIYILTLILPFYFGNDVNINKSETLKVLQANVLKSNTKYQLLLDQITILKPDIILLLETDSAWNNATKILANDYPHSFKSIEENSFGFIFYSKLPIQKKELVNFGTSFDCLDIFLDWNGSKIRFIGAHPPPPITGYMLEERNIHLLKYAELIKQEKDTPTIICGDLNITPWSPCYKMLVDQAQLKSTRQGFGLLGSWPASLPYRIPIDHCLLTKQFGIQNTQVLPSINSDHLPMLNEIFLKK